MEPYSYCTIVIEATLTLHGTEVLQGQADSLALSLGLVGR